MTIISVPCVLTPRLTIGTTSSTSAADLSNLQLIRVELPTRNSTKKIDKSGNEKLVNRASTAVVDLVEDRAVLDRMSL